MDDRLGIPDDDGDILITWPDYLPVALVFWISVAMLIVSLVFSTGD